MDNSQPKPKKTVKRSDSLEGSRSFCYGELQAKLDKAEGEVEKFMRIRNAHAAQTGECLCLICTNLSRSTGLI